MDNVTDNEYCFYDDRCYVPGSKTRPRYAMRATLTRPAVSHGRKKSQARYPLARVRRYAMRAPRRPKPPARRPGRNHNQAWGASLSQRRHVQPLARAAGFARSHAHPAGETPGRAPAPLSRVGSGRWLVQRGNRADFDLGGHACRRTSPATSRLQPGSPMPAGSFARPLRAHSAAARTASVA